MGERSRPRSAILNGMNQQPEYVKIENPTDPTDRLVPGTMAIIRSDAFRCLATLGCDGIWRDAHLQPVQVREIETQIW